MAALFVSGDYYDWIAAEDGSVYFALGDVSDKGVSAALLMSYLRASLHAEIGRSSPKDIVLALHQSFAEAVELPFYATFILARVFRDRNVLSFCNAGHNPGFVVSDGRLHQLPASEPPLGMLDILHPSKSAAYSESEVPFGPGDTLVLYSDGITESRNSSGLFGENRLSEIVAKLGAGNATAAEICSEILERVGSYAHGRLDHDDITLLVVRRRASPAVSGATASSSGHP
jgi:sigma-B regulation protein RsbU (phosphoserine phosphatase)